MINGNVYILGAGVSGLLIGYELSKRRCSVKIYERLAIPGGLARTERFEEYFIDSGPHLFHTSNPEIISYWETLFPNVFHHPSLYGKNYVDAQLFEYPLSEETLKLLPSDVYRAVVQELSELEVYRRNSANSYKEFIKTLVGPTLQKMFYEEYPEKLWGIPTDKLSPNWAPRRIEIRKERKPFHAGQWAGVPKLGCGQVMEILHEKIKSFGGKITYSTRVTGLRSEDCSVTAIQFTEGEIPLDYDDIVISTLPITHNASFLEIPCSLTFRNLKIVCLLVDRRDILPSGIDWVYFKEKKIIFHRVCPQSHFYAEGIPEGKDILCCEIAYSHGDAIDRASQADIIQRSTDDLVSLGLLEGKNVIKSHFMDLGPVYPGYYVGYEKELQKVKSALEKYSNFYSIGALGGFSYGDLQILTAKAIDLVNILTDKSGYFNRVEKKRRKITSFAKTISVGQHAIGEGNPPYVIAEIGLNHNGSVKLAHKLIDAAAESGCQAVKFQTFNKDRLSKKVRQVRYAEDLLDLEENLYQLFSRLIFSVEDLQEIFDYAKRVELDVFSTPFDIESVEILEKLGVPAYKISSMDLVNTPLIRHVASKMKPVIISTGMSTLGDIEETVNLMLEIGNPNLVLLHCVSSYPCPVTEANLRMIPTLAQTFQALVGFSDHSDDIYLAPPAVALGARVIEKHITLNRRMKGPDHVFSLEPDTLRKMIEQVCGTFLALGSGMKSISASEHEALLQLGRSIFAKRDIKKGTAITKDMLIIKSPGIGIMPKYLDLIVGRVAIEDIYADYPVTWQVI